MFLDQDYKGLTKEQLQERLKELRERRKVKYTMPKKSASAPRVEPLPCLEGVNAEIATKILEELLANMQTGALTE